MSRSARLAVALALIPVAEWFPEVPIVEPDLEGLSGPDVGLATAIHRTTLQRWLTLEHLLARHLKQPVRKLLPETRAVLVSGAAQLVFMDRLPAYAVIDEAVRLTKKLGVPRTSGVVNAVLRKLADLVVQHAAEPWSPAADRVPYVLENRAIGSVIFSEAVLPKTDNMLAHLVVATSLPMPLLQRWFKAFGRERATTLALQSLGRPPTFVVDNEQASPWTGTREELVGFLEADAARRVQDPASLASVAAAADLSPPPKTILDLCAGRGTKTRQLQQVFLQAKITTHDPDDDRRADLEEIPGITVAEPGPGEKFELIVLDVPCSNTGVLARRPGARYRATQASLESVVALQREIMVKALGHLADGGRILYCTCSIDATENNDQVAWLVEQRPGLTVLKESLLLPQAEGSDSSSGASDYHDGSYHAVVGSIPVA